MTQNDDKKSSIDNGSFWTSYSDLFSGLSVIFLVMFFFATLRLGVEQLKNANDKKKTQEYLSGNIPKDVAQKNNQQKTIIQKTLKDIQYNKDLLSQNAQTVNNLVNNLNAQQEVMSDLLNDQLVKNTALAEAYKRNQNLNKKKQELELLTKNLNEKLAEKEKNILEEQKNVTSLMTRLAHLEDDRKSWEEKYKSAEQQVDKKVTLISQLQSRVQELSQSSQDLNQKLEGEISKVGKLEEKIQSKDQELEKSNRAFELAKQQISNLSEKLSKKDKEVGTFQNEVSQMKAQLSNMSKDFEQKKGELTQLKADLSNKDSQIVALMKRVESGQKDKETCLTQLASAKAAPKPSILEPLRSLAGVIVSRKDIAQDIQRSFQEKGIDTQLNPESGILTLSLDETVHFKSDSYEVTDQAKDVLKKILPIYAEKLFGKAANASRIAAVYVTGHASPWHKSKYIDPNNNEKWAVRALNYNMNLSKKRAQQVTDFIFGKEIGSYPFKNMLKAKTKTVGKGYTEPLKPSSGETAKEACGPYDCAKSRRVEISFVLKGEHSSKGAE